MVWLLLLGWRPSLSGRRPSHAIATVSGWRPSQVVRRPLLLGWRPSLLGWRPSLSGWRPSQVVRVEAIAIRLEAIAIRLEAIAIRMEAIAIRSGVPGLNGFNCQVQIFGLQNSEIGKGTPRGIPGKSLTARQSRWRFWTSQGIKWTVQLQESKGTNGLHQA